jgi:hypothetical protein
MIKVFYFTLLLLIFFPLDSSSFYREIETINYEGTIYSIRIIKHQPIEIYIFDQDDVPVDVSTIDVVLFNDSEEGNVEVPVKLRIIENHFIIADKTAANEPYRLAIKSLNDGKREAFNLQLNKVLKGRQALLGSQ